MKATPPGPAPQVSIVIPVFNKSDLTAQCLAALGRVKSRATHEVIVVDNASTDDTPARLLAATPRPLILRNETNRGFAAACNQGAGAAAGKYLLFLNNDTIPQEGWLDALVDELRTHPTVVAVGAKLLYENRLVQHAGVAFARESRNPFHPHRLLRADDPRVNVRRELQAVTAACLLVRANAFAEAGRFSEDFQNGYEDLDLCLNLRRRGGVIVYQPKSVVIHLESQTPGRKHHDNENRRRFFQRWADAVLSDEDAYYFEGGCRLLRRRDERSEEGRLTRFESEAERRQWLVVVEAQRLAAAGQRDELIQRLAAMEGWPSDAAVRRWAGMLCRKLGQPGPAQQHFAAALALETEPELRAQLAAALGDGSPAAGPVVWESALRSAFQHLRAGDFPSARSAFDTALVQGVPPRLVLPGLWQCAERSGAADAAVTREALLTLPRVSASVGRQLAAPAAAAAAPTTADRVSIIVLAHNQLEHTRACLESVSARTPTPHEIIVVDNGSTDGTPEFLRSWQAMDATRVVIRNESNLGFAAGNNQGLAAARGPHVLLLNNDTVVTDGWLAAMLAVFAQHPDTGVVGPMSNRVSGPQWVREADYPGLDALPAFAAGWAQAHRGQTLEVGRVVGFCLLARRAVIDQIGGLDEQFGSGNFEDDDFCVRARLAGFGIRVAMDSFVHHTGSQTFKGARIDYRQAMQRNWDLFCRKWRLPAEASIEQGYAVPKVLPEGVALRVDLPGLPPAPRAQDDRGRNKISSPQTPTPVRTGLPAVAGLGRLDGSRARLGQGDLPGAWRTTLAAMTARPFHPEGALLLAEIALAAGDAVNARRLAQHARALAPGWKAAKTFLQKHLKGNAHPDWLVLPDNLRQASASRAPRLSVCLITKNEERFLARCLESVGELAPQIVVVDTGSTDRTVEIATAHGAEVHAFAWGDDFSAARNAALEHATGDWVLVLDADEEMSAAGRERLRRELQDEKVAAYRLPIADAGREPEGCNYVPRLFRNAPGVHFTGRIHEQAFASLEPLRAAWGLENRLSAATLIHHGYAQDVVVGRNKIERNLRLLERAVTEQPADANLRMNHGLELMRAGQRDAGFEQYRVAFDLLSALPSPRVSPELRETLLVQFSTHLIAAKRFAEVARLLEGPLARTGGLTASLHFNLGLACAQTGRGADAVGHFEQCLAQRDTATLTPPAKEIFTAAPHHCLAVCLAQLQRPEAALAAYQSALKAAPESREIRFDFARFCAANGHEVDALQLLHALVQTDASDAAAWRLGGQVALRQPQFLEVAGDWTAEAVRLMPEDPEILSQRAEALLLVGRAEESLAIWTRPQLPASHVRTAAIVFCRLLADAPHDFALNGEEPLVSREFLKWYRRLLDAGARAVIQSANARLAALRRTLPTVAGVLEQALASAEVASA